MNIERKNYLVLKKKVITNFEKELLQSRLTDTETIITTTFWKS